MFELKLLGYAGHHEASIWAKFQFEVPSFESFTDLLQEVENQVKKQYFERNKQLHVANSPRVFPVSIVLSEGDKFHLKSDLTSENVPSLVR